MSDSITHLKWACRRGMLELDLMLKKYLEGAYLESSSEDQALFARMLKEADQDLFTWLTGHQVPEKAWLQEIVIKVRTYVNQVKS